MELPEFGLSVNAAMCRNPMCENVGVDMDVAIPGASWIARGKRSAR